MVHATAPAASGGMVWGTTVDEHKAGSLACVGVGMMLGAHLTPRARSCIEQADVVFSAVSDGVVEQWLQKMHPDVRSLEPLYREGKSRMRTYREMVAAMLGEVRAGKRVCGAFYGHPGVFAWVPHKAVEIARGEGLEARMEPGISAEDCLYADLGFDPGKVGCQHYEATQFMLYQRRIDPSAWLVLWQVGLAGDRTLRRFATGEAYRQVLVDVLARDYSLDHEVVIYRAATLAIGRPRMERLALKDIPASVLGTQDTLVLPPGTPMQLDKDVAAMLADMDGQLEG